jgi:ribosomal protein L7/L12
MENWYYVSPKTEESVGPVSIGKLVAEATPETMVWKEESLPDWVAAKAHPDLADFQEVLANNSQELSGTKTVPSGPVKEDTSTYNIIINTEIVHKLEAVKVLRDELACSLFAAAQLVETIPALVKSGLSLTEAETLSKRLATNGIITHTVKVENGEKNNTTHTENITNHATSENQPASETLKGVTGIVVTTSYNPLKFLTALWTPIIEIDGEPFRTKWGYNFFDRPPGKYNVKVYCQLFFNSQLGANDMTINIEANEIVKIKFSMPTVGYRGDIRLEP